MASVTGSVTGASSGATPNTGATTVTINRRSGNAALLGSLGAVAGGFMLISTLGGAYVAVRHGVGKEFVPTTMSFNNYAGFMVLFSVVLASFATEWAQVSLKVGQRRWVSGGYGLAAILTVAAMNLVWFIGSRLAMAVSDNPYATMVYALLAGAMALLAVSLASSVVSLVLSLSGHASSSNPRPVRAAAWLVHLASFGWLAVYALIFLYK